MKLPAWGAICSLGLRGSSIIEGLGSLLCILLYPERSESSVFKRVTTAAQQQLFFFDGRGYIKQPINQPRHFTHEREINAKCILNSSTTAVERK